MNPGGLRFLVVYNIVYIFICTIYTTVYLHVCLPKDNRYESPFLGPPSCWFFFSPQHHSFTPGHQVSGCGQRDGRYEGASMFNGEKPCDTEKAGTISSHVTCATLFLFVYLYAWYIHDIYKLYIIHIINVIYIFYMYIYTHIYLYSHKIHLIDCNKDTKT